MITPAPTSKLAPGLARGILVDYTPALEASGLPGLMKLHVPGTSYELHLIPAGPVHADLGKRIVGRLAARARRIDVVRTGGRFIEPVFGRPQRIQGTVVSVDASAGTLCIDAGVPIHVTPTAPNQSAARFEPGQLVSFDALEGTTFAEVRPE